jgi:hypothetical protein
MKMRHVSVFQVKEEARTPETIEFLAEQLRTIPAAVPTVLQSEVGVKPFPMPTQSPDGQVEFYDLIQIITFASEEDCMAYPMTPGHQALLETTNSYIQQVVGIDFPVTE